MTESPMNHQPREALPSERALTEDQALYEELFGIQQWHPEPTTAKPAAELSEEDEALLVELFGTTKKENDR